MYIQLGGLPESDYDNPIGLLSDCHRRIEGFLAALLKVARGAGPNTLEGNYRSALEASLRYFSEAAPNHTHDEEESLFPRLRKTKAGRRVLAQVERLEADHQVAEALHHKVDQAGQEWLRVGSLPPSQRSEFLGCLEQLEELYTAHIHLEDTKLFPLAARVLKADQLLGIGQEMAARRGVQLAPSRQGGPANHDS
jgi:hemerythrin-like domain-containing protein